jgi:hypothetical protein
MANQGLGPYAAVISTIAALFVGFLQLPGWLLLMLSVLAVYGMRYYYPTNFQSVFSYITNFVLVFCFLSIMEWVARIASLYMTGHQFIGQVE